MSPPDFDDWVDTSQDCNSSVHCSLGVDNSSSVEEVNTPYRLPHTVFVEVSFHFILNTPSK